MKVGTAAFTGACLYRQRHRVQQYVRVVVAQFEEKTYEIAYDIELSSGAGGTPTLWAPGQVLEHLLGFDATGDPQPDHVLWTVLTAPRPPGIVLLSSFWPGLPKAAAAQLPSRPASFIVQYKRPEYLHGGRAKQWSFWRAPYFRFKIDSGQQRVLKRLEVKLGREALVRYAAPAFHSSQQLEIAQMQRSVITQSGHVPPSALAGHSAWTYQYPGNAGRANPGGETHAFYRLEDMFSEPREGDDTSNPISAALVSIDGVAEHVSDVARAVTLHEPQLRKALQLWRRELQHFELTHTDVSRAVDFAAIQTMMSRLGASWQVLDSRTLAG
jgi:hypothetical protein